DDERSAAVERAQPRDGLVGLAVGEEEVEQHDVDGIAAELLEALRERPRAAHVEALVPRLLRTQAARHLERVEGFVFDEQDPSGCRRHHTPPSVGIGPAHASGAARRRQRAPRRTLQTPFAPRNFGLRFPLLYSGGLRRGASWTAAHRSSMSRTIP